jgi:alpha-mannosidase
MKRFVLLSVVLLVIADPAVPHFKRRIYIANDDHTDYLWSSDEAGYRNAFLDMLDRTLDHIDGTAGLAPEFQSRFSADGHFWFWTYERNRPANAVDRLVERIRDGHITIPMQTLVLCYGGMPLEAVLRSLYYAGSVERRYGLRFSLASAMENATQPFGLPSVWAGSGARFSWKGVCACATKVSGYDRRAHEIYRAVGPDGRSVLLKWHSLIDGNQSSGGYAEARDPAHAVQTALSDPRFLARYPFDPVVGMFGYGWDDLSSFTDRFVSVAREWSKDSVQVIVSNEVDFFEDFLRSAPPDSIPAYAAGFGNEWDLYCVSMAEVTASVRRAVESLRTAEALASWAAIADPAFPAKHGSSLDSAFVNMGLYYEHNWTNDGPVSHLRPAFQRKTAAQIVCAVRAYCDAALGAFSTKVPAGDGKRIVVFNPLGWRRDGSADLADPGGADIRIVDEATGREAPSQRVRTDAGSVLRIFARGVPPLGYRIYSLRNEPGSFQDSSAAVFAHGILENSFYRIAVDNRGALTGVVDKRSGRQWVAAIDGLAWNDFGAGAGSAVLENDGPVSTTVAVETGGFPPRRLRLTLYAALDRIDLDNELLDNFGDGAMTAGFGFNLAEFTARHEEIGAVATAKPLSRGGHYADALSRVDFLTLNHFVDLSDGESGVTLSSWDCPFFKLGRSAGSSLDTQTPLLRVLVGGRIDAPLGVARQDGDRYFLARFALRSHGAYEAPDAMRFALEHQNPLIAVFAAGPDGAPFSAAADSLIEVSDPRVLAWAVKPAEDRAKGGLALRVWNLDARTRTVSIRIPGASILEAFRTTHLETVIEPVGHAGDALTDTLASQWLQTYSVRVSCTPSGVGEVERLPRHSVLYQNFPNPFNPVTVIRFSLPDASHVRLSVLNLLGREHGVLVDEARPAGSHAVRWDATGLSSGVYVCRFEVNGRSHQAKMVFLK